MNRALLLAGLAFGGYHLYRAVKPRYDYRDKHVMITGGSRGLGLALAQELARRGANLSICSRHGDQLDTAAAQLRGLGAKVFAEPCDLRDPGAVRRFVASAQQNLGPVDVLIHNAGVIQVGPLDEMTEDDFRESLEIHFWASYYAVMAVLPGMRARKRGRVVNVTSIGGKIAVPHLLPYSTGKFALAGFSDGLRAELAQDGIVVTTVYPGLMRTGSHLNAEFKGRHEDEYAWFAAGNATPGLSSSAASAANSILNSCALGDSELVVGLSAKFGAITRALMPNLTGELLALVNRHVLPEPGGIGTGRMKGHQSRGKLPPAVTTLSDRAAKSYNETPAR